MSDKLDEIAEVKELWRKGPFIVDPEHGMMGSPCVIGPIGIVGFQRGHASDAEVLRDQLNQAWAFGVVAGRQEDRAEIERLRAGWEQASEVGRQNIAQHFRHAAELRAEIERLRDRNQRQAGLVEAAENRAEAAEASLAFANEKLTQCFGALHDMEAKVKELEVKLGKLDG